MEVRQRKEIIKAIINREITERKSNLLRVKNIIKIVLHCLPNRIDNAYIERKYLKCCSMAWILEIAETLKKLSDEKNGSIFREIFNSLDEIQELRQVSNIFNQLDYYKLLMVHFILIDKVYEKTLISGFKKECLKQLVSYNEAAERELVFLKILSDFLSNVKNVRSINAFLFFHKGTLSLPNFLRQIINLKVDIHRGNLTDLQEAAKSLQCEKCLFFMDHLKKVIGVYIKPIELKTISVDGRLAIVVTGRNFALSEILSQLERELSTNSAVEEVRFIAASTLHVDEDMTNVVWQGKNIVVLTKVMKIHRRVVWNVSGKDDTHVYSSDAGTAVDGQGKRGEDGHPGESGGNVLILVDKRENVEKLEVVSNGGKGSRGQDGGKGRDGKDGISITWKEFIEEPPSRSVFDFFGNSTQMIVLNRIKREASRLKTLWHMGREYKALQDINPIGSLGDIFIEAVTNSGNEIIFFFNEGTILVETRMLLLCKGSAGQKGSSGGEGGSGGGGGLAGRLMGMDIQSHQKFEIRTRTRAGDCGANGTDGLCGNNGRNGWDMGYVGPRLWYTRSKEKVFEGSKLELRFDGNKSEWCVWCPNKRKYAEIVPSERRHGNRVLHEERAISRQSFNRHFTSAQPKKTISERAILSSYSHHLNSIEGEMLKALRSNLEETKQLSTEAIIDNQEKQMNTTRMKIDNFVYRTRSANVMPTSSSVNVNKKGAEHFVCQLRNGPRLLDGIMVLPEKKYSSGTMNYTTPEIEKSIDKYRLDSLRDISKILSLHHKNTNTCFPQLTAESVVKYLVEENGKDTSHPIPGTLNQYLYEDSQKQRQTVFEFLNQDTNKEALKCAIRVFILEVEKSLKVSSSIIKYKEQLEKLEKSANMFFEVFFSELSRPRHEAVFDLWIRSIKEESLKCDLEKKIQKDTFLNVLYNRFNCQLRQEYNWEECYEDEDILKEYTHYIRKKGAFSSSYRELLAHTFHTNIRLYVERKHGLSLTGNHNPTCKLVTHVLQRDNTFVKLSIDEDYVILEEKHNKENDIYARVLAETDSFKLKQEFDDYLEKQTFMSNQENERKSEKHFPDTYVTSEEDDIRTIVDFFPEEERQEMEARLEKIKSQYIGRQEILHNMMKRFSCEGRYVSSHVLTCLVNSILSSCVEDRNELNTFSWIVAAYSQTNWIDELILLQVEHFFKKLLTNQPKYRQFLSNIENKDTLILFYLKLDRSKASVSIQCVEDIFYLLSNIINVTANLEGLELSEWPYALKEEYWNCKLSNVIDRQKNDLRTASYYVCSMENTFGTNLVEKFIDILKEKEQHILLDKFTDILSNFHHGKWNLSEFELDTLKHCDFDQWTEKMLQRFTVDEKRNVNKLVELIRGNSNTSKNISDNLPEIEEYIQSINDEKYAIDGRSVKNFTEDDIKKSFKELLENHGNGKQGIENTYLDMLALIDRTIELKRGYRLRDTQKLTVLTLLRIGRGTLAQVSTGEGKSLIVVATSIIKALFGEKVDIITSSSVLAKRDVDSNRDIYSVFDVNVAHNCIEDIEKRKEAYSCNQVLYGDLSNFQRDYLLDKFYRKDILGDRNFENVIVDEVDSMLLDNGNNMLYLSHGLAGLSQLESVYIYIWQWINRPVGDNEDISYAFNIKAIKESVLKNLYVLLRKDDIGQLSSDLSEKQKNIIWGRLIGAQILDNRGLLLKENISDNELNQVLKPEFNNHPEYKDRLNYLLMECREIERHVKVPNYLKPFVERHLESWINSAVTAFCMVPGQDYVVDVDRSGTSSDRNPNIIIIDRDTGTDKVSSQWCEALHQFLQLKHGCKLSLQSLKAVYVSNVSFFKLYKHLYGLTGTLGSHRDKDLLQEIHKVDFVTIPTFQSKKFRELKPILCTTKEDWINSILNEAKNMVVEKRSILVICETVNDVELLRKAFERQNSKQVYTYTRDYEEFDIVQGTKELQQEEIIIATNLAGRGTDVNISEGLRQAGGLHICLTYLPKNTRIEQQAFGRAARSGDKGSGQIIFINSEGDEYSNAKTLVLKAERDAMELHRISDMKAYYESQINVEEDCFRKFREQYEQLKNDLDDNQVPAEVQEILLQSCLDEWAFWLDENGRCINNLKSDHNFNLLKKFISQFKGLNIRTLVSEHNLPSWLTGHPNQIIKLGTYLSQNIEHRRAIQLFNEVIKREPYFSEAAHYFKAFALIKSMDVEQNNGLKRLKNELREASRHLQNHTTFCMQASGIIGKMKKINEGVIQIDAYEEQQMSLCSLYNIFSQSIEDILGHTLTPDNFVDYGITEESAEILYADLLREGFLKKPKVKNDISEEKLKVISSDYGVEVERLQNFLSNYKGKEINDKEFLKALEEEIHLPSREEFWKSLVYQETLTEEVECVVIDLEKLEEVDSLLLAFLKKEVEDEKIKKQTVDSGDIFLYVERMPQEKNDNTYIILKKEDFITAYEDKYHILKKKGMLSCNCKAHMHKPDKVMKKKIVSPTFHCYDSICAQDFTKVNIAPREVENILDDLVKQKVIEKDTMRTKNTSYRLKANFDEIVQVQLPKCPIYESAVKRLLTICFSYRIALQKIMKQIEHDNHPIHLQLMSKPHQHLFSELLQQRIVRPTKVSREHENFEKKLNCVYGTKWFVIDDIKDMLLQGGLNPENCTDTFLNHLVDMNWITKFKPIEQILNPIITDPNIRDFFMKFVGNEVVFLTQDFYYVNCLSERNTHLSSSYKDIEYLIKSIFDLRLMLGKEVTMKNIARKLEHYKSTFKTLNAIDAKLKPLTEFCGDYRFVKAEELYVFFINGLNQVLELQEKKWTRQMLLNTAVVAVMGLTQILIGVAIELYSAGSMSHVGAAFINEGVGDIFFAAGALSSGHFSWKDYKRHKIESLIMTSVTAGIGMYLSGGTKMSRFGRKIANPHFEVGGKKVSEMCGSQLIEIATWKTVRNEVAKRVAKKSIEGVAFGLANAGVDRLVENYFQSLCTSISSFILSNIESEIESHDISKNILKAFTLFGKEDAENMIHMQTDYVFSMENFVNKLLSIANRISNSIDSGITNAVKKGFKMSNTRSSVISFISKAAVWSERAVHIKDIVKITGSFLDNINAKIMDELNCKQDESVEGVSDETRVKDYDNFKKEIIKQWKLLLCDKADSLIAQHVISPILNIGANCVLRYVGKKIQEGYLFYKESENQRSFEEGQLKFAKSVRDATEKESNSKSEIIDAITQQYHEDLLKVMKKTRNPRLFAAIVRENVPMDFTCVNACVQSMLKILSDQGINLPALTIIVEGDGGIKQSFSTAPEGVDGKTVTLQLRDNHFQLHGNGAPESRGEGVNDCLFESLSEHIPELKNVTRKYFRDMTAHYIEHCSDIQHHIQRGWHILPISMGAYGGSSSNNNTRESSSQQPIPNYEHAKWKVTENDVTMLLTNKTLTNEETHLQLTKGFNEALKQIKRALFKMSGKETFLDPSIFTATDYDTILCSTPFGVKSLAQYPVEMVGEIELKGKDGVRRKYKFEINVDNPKIDSTTEGPRGPHVGYKVFSKGEHKKTVGHILLNRNGNLPDRGSKKFSVGDNSIPKIPIPRLFFERNRPNKNLVRVDDKCIYLDDKGRLKFYPKFAKTLENRSFPSYQFF